MKLRFFKALLFICCIAAPATAQNYPPPTRIEGLARATSATALMTERSPIRLWALQDVGGMNAAFDLRARTALDNAIGQGAVICDIKSHSGSDVWAQCVNRRDKDLGLLMLQQGFATVDRAAVFGTAFEDAYLQAEMQAQNRALGVWGESAGGRSQENEGRAFVSFGFAMFLCLIAVFAVLSVVIMRGFQRVIDAQNRNVDLMTQERKLRDQERRIVAIMLDSELKANKAKIDAYRVVYEEMLRGLRDPDKTARYKKAGDVIQKQPALARSVFDRNADKLDILGDRLSSELIHFYARIKSQPEYYNIEPGAPLEEVTQILEKSLNNANRLNELAERLLAAFATGGISSQNYDYEASL